MEDPTSFDYIKEEIGYRVADRVMDVRYAVHSYLDALFGTKNSTKLFPLEHYFPLPLFSDVTKLINKAKGLQNILRSYVIIASLRLFVFVSARSD